MKAKDTIMSAEAIAELQARYSEPSNESIGYERNIAKAQAEISFLAGIREVVGWIVSHSFYASDSPPEEGKGYIYLGNYILKYGNEANASIGFYELTDSPEWQSQMNSWGIEE